MIVRGREPQATCNEDNRVRAGRRLTWRDDRGGLAVADKRREPETAPVPLGAGGGGVVNDAGTGAGEIRDEAVGRARKRPGLGHELGVGSVQRARVLDELALGRSQRRRERHRRDVRAAATERGKSTAMPALESGDHRNDAAADQALDPRRSHAS